MRFPVLEGQIRVVFGRLLTSGIVKTDFLRNGLVRMVSKGGVLGQECHPQACIGRHSGRPDGINSSETRPEIGPPNS